MTRRAAQTAIVVAALFSFLCQTVLAQAHYHPRTAAAATLGVGATLHVAVGSGQPVRDQPVDCPVCRELAHTGAYIMPGSITFGVPSAAAIWLGAMPPFGSALVRRSHAWRSRAPPLHSEA